MDQEPCHHDELDHDAVRAACAGRAVSTGRQRRHSGRLAGLQAMHQGGAVMAGEHLCHCGHEELFHFSTNNDCGVMGCPCSEGFQHKWMAISTKLAAALAKNDDSARERLREMNRP